MVSTFPTRSTHQKRESRSMHLCLLSPFLLIYPRNAIDPIHLTRCIMRTWGSRNFMENRRRDPVTKTHSQIWNDLAKRPQTFILALRIFRGDVSILCQALCVHGWWEREKWREWSWNSRRETRNLSEARKACNACSSFDVTVLHSIPLKKTERFRFFGQI